MEFRRQQDLSRISSDGGSSGISGRGRILTKVMVDPEIPQGLQLGLGSPESLKRCVNAFGVEQIGGGQRLKQIVNIGRVGD